jgi:hypothetical protein
VGCNHHARARTVQTGKRSVAGFINRRAGLRNGNRSARAERLSRDRLGDGCRVHLSAANQNGSRGELRTGNHKTKPFRSLAPQARGGGIVVTDSFYEEGSNVLTPGAFDFVLDFELKRAHRSENYLTLVIVEAHREWEGVLMTADYWTREVARLIGPEVRDTDLIGFIEKGSLGLVLFDADAEQSSLVIDRLFARIRNYEFPTALQITMGAACYPTHAMDADSLKRQALSRPVANWRGMPDAS